MYFIYIFSGLIGVLVSIKRKWTVHDMLRNLSQLSAHNLTPVMERVHVMPCALTWVHAVNWAMPIYLVPGLALYSYVEVFCIAYYK